MSQDKDEIVKMAREAGFAQDWQFAVPPATLSSFATLCRAPLIAEVERLTFTLNQEALARENVSALRAQLADEVDSLKAERDNWKARAEAAEAKLARVRAGEPTSAAPVVRQMVVALDGLFSGDVVVWSLGGSARPRAAIEAGKKFIKENGK